jgi:protein TonB
MSGIFRKYLLGLSALVERQKSYPYIARQRGQQGQVRVRFVVERDGCVSDIRVVGSSGYPSLDADAADTLRRVGRVPPLPREIGSDRLRLEIPLTYRLSR